MSGNGETVSLIIRNNLIDFDKDTPFRWWIEFQGKDYTVYLEEGPGDCIVAKVLYDDLCFEASSPRLPSLGGGIREAITAVGIKLITYLRRPQEDCSC